MSMSKAYPKYNEYRILNCAGEWETWRIPGFMDPQEVARHRQHSVVCMFLRPGFTVFVDGSVHRGPRWLVWDRSKCDWGMVLHTLESVSELELYKIGC